MDGFRIGGTTAGTHIAALLPAADRNAGLIRPADSSLLFVVRPAGFEPATLSSED